MIVSIILALLIFTVFRLYIDSEMYDIPKVKYSSITPETGDLIVFRWNYVDAGFRLFSKFSHVGMVVNVKDELFILEIHPEENNKKNEGVHLYSLKKRLDSYNGDCYYSKLECKKSRSLLSKNISENIKEYKCIPFDNNFRNVFVSSAIYKKFGYEPSVKKTMFCSEFIAHVLKKSGVKSDISCLSFYNPGSFLNLKTDTTCLYTSLFKLVL